MTYIFKRYIFFVLIYIFCTYMSLIIYFLDLHIYCSEKYFLLFGSEISLLLLLLLYDSHLCDLSSNSQLP